MADMKPMCLIVGAGPGIGQAAAVAFAREGYGCLEWALPARYATESRWQSRDVRGRGCPKSWR